MCTNGCKNALEQAETKLDSPDQRLCFIKKSKDTKITNIMVKKIKATANKSRSLCRSRISQTCQIKGHEGQLTVFGPKSKFKGFAGCI